MLMRLVNSMNNENLLTGTKKGRIIIAVGVMFGIVILLSFVLILTGVIHGNEKKGILPVEERVTIEIDPISGETIRKVQQDTEIKDGQIIMIGLYQLKKMGMMADHYSKLINTLAKYLSENRPNVKQISYKKDSYKYLSKDYDKAYFMFVTDEGESFDVNLDTKNSIKDVTIKITKHEDE